MRCHTQLPQQSRNARTVGVGVLSYGLPHETLRLVHSLLEADPAGRCRICVYDNTDSGAGVCEAWYNRLAHSMPRVSVLGDGKNVGCSVARNRLRDHFKLTYPGMQYMAILDQDIVVRPGWCDDMLEVMTAHADAGQVIWPVFNMARDQPDACGRIHDAAGGASLYRLRCLEATQGWDSRFFFFRFDSWFTLRAYALGWPTYMVTKYGAAGEDWSTWLDRYGGRPEVTCGPISHVNPSRGTKRHPDYLKIREASQRLFESLLSEHKLENLYKNWPNHTA